MQDTRGCFWGGKVGITHNQTLIIYHHCECVVIPHILTDTKLLTYTRQEEYPANPGRKLQPQNLYMGALTAI